MNQLITTAGGIAAEIERRLKLIRIADGYETDIGRKVQMGLQKLPGEDDVPVCVVNEGEDDVSDRPGRLPQVLVSQLYALDGFDACDPDRPNDKAHMILRDIKRVLFAETETDGTTWGARVSKVDYNGRRIGTRPDGVALVQARVLITVSYVETLATP